MTAISSRTALERALQCWANDDFNGVVACFADDIVYLVNVDGLRVTFASSAVGKEDVRWRLQHVLDTFHIDSFCVEHVEHGDAFTRARVRHSYRHKKTGERLDIAVRFHGWVRDGLLVRVEEVHDAAYIEAFDRFVAYLSDPP